MKELKQDKQNQKVSYCKLKSQSCLVICKYAALTTYF